MTNKFKKSLAVAAVAGVAVTAAPEISTDGFNINVGIQNVSAETISKAVSVASSTAAATSNDSDSTDSGAAPGDGPGTY
ncbi:hypothetical protein [uncultured Sneathiella sp.]|uniref:hypothetical protein n=1 Tax=uncultured Sneathiella sp. TaxID=879315 RepID=UPI00259A4852|nr:hypothetical protein [uncultured Sneathiella sp.]